MPFARPERSRAWIHPEVAATGFVMKPIVHSAYGCSILTIGACRLCNNRTKIVKIKRSHKFAGINSYSNVSRYSVFSSSDHSIDSNAISLTMASMA